jgi:hypothetical protein
MICIPNEKRNIQGGKFNMEDRVENWKKFAEHMEKYIQERTVEKYGVKNSDETAGFDLMSITRNPLICVWNILRYSLRIWNGKQKTHDIEKIAHYAELAWTMADGEVIKNDG